MVWKLVDSIALRLADVGGLVLRRVLGLFWDYRYSGSGIDLLSRRGGMTDHAMVKNGEARRHMFNYGCGQVRNHRPLCWRSPGWIMDVRIAH